MKWIEIKELVMKARYIIGGLILTYIPQEFEQSSFVSNLGNHTFGSGLANGMFLGMKIIGVCIFAYGIAYYAQKNAIVEDRESH